MNPYQYPPLSGPRCTRVITLHPGTTKDPSCPLRCDLEEIDLDNPPDYLALSYTWNGETPSEPLTIGNAQADSRQATGSQLLITPNCAAALRAFRKSLHRRINMRKHLTLWVDAICINQGSNDDKSTQVEMMAEIFERAKRVVVWLGNQDSPTTSRPILFSLACVVLPHKYIGRLNGFFKWTECSKALKWFNPRFESLKELAADAVSKGCDENTIHAILRSSYWTRAWTVQEFANTHVSILCQNSKMISFAGLMKMIFNSDQLAAGRPWLHRRLYAYCRAFGHFDLDPLMVDHVSLGQFLGLQASEPRDRIFAFHAMSNEVFAKIKVDYQRPLQDLFAETSMTVIRETNNLYLLYFASLEKTSPGTENGSMPSWSLDFGTRDHHEDYRGVHMDQYISTNASRGSRPWISFPDGGVSLRVSGRSAGVIGNLIGNVDPIGNSLLVAKMAMEDESRQEFEESDTRSVSLIEENYDNYEDRLGQLMRHFVSILRRKLGADPRSEAKMAMTLLELMQGIAEATSLQPVTIPSLAPNSTFEDLLEALCDDTYLGFRIKYRMGEGRMFFTTDGRAGLGVPRISDGDEVFLIAGLKHPFVLRPHGENGEYTLVGPAVLTGMMKGELWPEDESELRDIDIV